MKAGRIATAALIVFALCAITLAVYIGGYLCLGRTYPVTMGRYIGPRLIAEQALRREYPHHWQVTVFEPLGKLETLLRRQEVDIAPRPPQPTIIR